MKKFLADGMLRGLLRWLRFLGFDTLEYQSPEKEDKETDTYRQRYFLTTSPTHFRNWKEDKKILIPFEKIPDQLNYLNRKLNIFVHIKFLSRCSICNEAIISVKKGNNIDELPEISREILINFINA